MYEEVKKKLYGLLAARNVAFEINEEISYANFCCLQLKRYPLKEATLMTGRFSDDLREVIYIAHELGHLMHYESMTGEEAELAYCTIFASNHAGLENISPEAKERIIFLEKSASQNALRLLTSMLDEEKVREAAETYRKWIDGYHLKANSEKVQRPIHDNEREIPHE